VRRLALVSFGSRGDLFPLLGIGQGLRRRGYEVAVWERHEYRRDVEAAGLRYRELPGGSAVGRAFAGSAGLSGLARMVRRGLLPHVEPWARAIAAAGRIDAVVSYDFQYAGQCAAELLGVPLVTVMGPNTATTLYPPTPGDRRHAERTLDLVDRLAGRYLDRARDALGLPRRTRAASRGSVSDRAVLVLGSPLYPAGTWPPHFRRAAYPAYDGPRSEVAGDLSAFLRRDDLGPLVVCTLGDSYRVARPAPVARHLVKVARGRNLRLLSLVPGTATGDGGDPRIVEHSFVPLSTVLPHAAAAVHHGGMGTLMATVRAGVPSVLVPRWLDGKENARRGAAAGIGRLLAEEGLDDQALDRELGAVLADDSFRRATAEMAAVAARDPDAVCVADACLADAVGQR
jgi:UDP:flavonoid glycosyltransferase YjiC (YdhE family)